MKPRRILIVCAGGLLSGKEIVSVTLARELRRQGWEVEFLTSRWGASEYRDLLAANGFTVHQLWLGFIAASLRRDALAMTLDQLRRWPGLAYRRLLADRAPEVVIHTNWHHALLLTPFLKPRRDIYWSHELLPAKAQYGAVFRLIASRVGRMVCVSQAAARSVTALGVPASKVAVVHNGVAFDVKLRAPPAKSPLRVGIVGQIAEWKGHEDALAAVGELARRGVKVRLEVFGRGEADYVNSLRRQAEALGIANQVHWRGFVSCQAEVYRDIDVCLIPSRFEEPFATSALEAGCFGRPVVAAAVGGLPEIVRDGETGRLVEPRQPGRLAEAIEAFVHDPTLVSSMGAAARRRVSQEFSPARCGDGFVRIIDSLPGPG